MNRADFEQAPCHCGECYQAGVNERPQIRDRFTGKWLHGHDLRRWYDARANFQRTFDKRLTKEKSL